MIELVRIKACVSLTLLVVSLFAACEMIPRDGGSALEDASAIEAMTADVTDAESAIPEMRWDQERALELVAFPLSCIDRPHRRSRRGAYLYEATYSLKPDYEQKLAFYGCFDWHSAVNSTWAMVKVLKEFPEAPIASLIREKLKHHLSKESLAGELQFFKEVARPGFERPYGWAWLLKLYAELATWDDPEAREWASNLAPLAELLAEKSVTYLEHLSAPIRAGTHQNTAFSLSFMHEYAAVVSDTALASSVEARAKEFSLEDKLCPVAYEPSGSDFLSPCLAESVMMARVLDAPAFQQWHQEFLPAPDAPEFGPLRTEVVIRAKSPQSEQASRDESSLATGPVLPSENPESGSGGGAEAEGEASDASDDDAAEEETKLVGARSHLIGLSFARSAALRRLAAALPPEHPHRPVYLRLAVLHGEHGFANMYEADYFGSHWLASFAVYMLTS